MAPFSSIQIVFEYSNPQLSFHVEQRTELTVPYRKVTMDNVEDIGEECKSASSGWELFINKMI